MPLAFAVFIHSDLFLPYLQANPIPPLRLFQLIHVSTVAVRRAIKITWAPAQKPVDEDRVAIIERLVQEAVDAFMDFIPAVANIRS